MQNQHTELFQNLFCSAFQGLITANPDRSASHNVSDAMELATAAFKAISGIEISTDQIAIAKINWMQSEKQS